MNWQTALRHAEERAGFILNMIDQAPERPGSIPLTEYPTLEDYQRILGDNPGYNWEEHRMVNKAVQRILKRHKLKAVFKPIHADDYLGWCTLQGRKNTSADRAEYIAIQTDVYHD